jgi:hypothetical protein
LQNGKVYLTWMIKQRDTTKTWSSITNFRRGGLTNIESYFFDCLICISITFSRFSKPFI